MVEWDTDSPIDIEMLIILALEVSIDTEMMSLKEGLILEEMNKEEMKWLETIHTIDTATRVATEAQTIMTKTITMDLMMSLLHQTIIKR